MADPNMTSILDRPASDVKRPPPYPTGTYTVMVKGLPRADKSSKKGTDFYEFELGFLQAHDDVDEDALTEIGGIEGKSIRHTYYITEKSGYRLVEWMRDDLGIEEEGKTPREMIDETPGRQCLITIKHTPSEDGKGVYANVDKTMPVGE